MGHAGWWALVLMASCSSGPPDLEGMYRVSQFHNTYCDTVTTDAPRAYLKAMRIDDTLIVSSCDFVPCTNGYIVAILDPFDDRWESEATSDTSDTFADSPCRVEYRRTMLESLSRTEVAFREEFRGQVTPGECTDADFEDVRTKCGDIDTLRATLMSTPPHIDSVVVSTTKVTVIGHFDSGAEVGWITANSNECQSDWSTSLSLHPICKLSPTARSSREIVAPTEGANASSRLGFAVRNADSQEHYFFTSDRR